MADYKTNRTFLLTQSGSLQGDIKSSMVFIPGPPGPGSLNYQNHGTSVFSASAFGCSVTANSATEAPGSWGYNVSISAGAGWPSGAVGNSFIVSGTYPQPGSINKNYGGSYTFSADVEESVTIGTGTVDLQGFASYGGSSAAKDEPTSVTEVYFLRPRVGGTVSVQATIDGVTKTASRVITQLDHDNLVVGLAGTLTAGIYLANTIDLIGEATGTCNGVVLTDSFSAAALGATIGCATGAKVSCTSAFAGSVVNGTNCSLSITPDKVANLSGVLRAMEGAYPGSLTVRVETAPGVTQDLAAGSTFSTTITQRQRTSGGHIQGTTYTGSNYNEFQPVRCWITPASLTSAGEDTLMWRCPMRAQSFGGLSISQAASMSLEANCLPANWTNVSNTTLTGAGPLTITVGAGAAGSCRTTLPVANSGLKGTSFSGVSFAGYRYLDIEIAADVDAQPFRVRMGSKVWSKDYAGADLVANIASRHVKIDIMGPSSSVSAIDATDTKWPYASVGPVVITDGPLSGVTNVSTLQLENLAISHVYTLRSLSLVASNHRLLTFCPAFNNFVLAVPVVSGSGTTTTTYVRRFLLGDTDWKQSLELEDVTKTVIDTSAGPGTPSYSPASIFDLVNNINGGSGAYPNNGYTATVIAPAPSATGMLKDDFLNRNSNCVYLGGAGISYTGGAWSYWFDKDVSTTLTVPAQLLIDAIDWYPGCGDVLGVGGGGGAGALELRPAAILRAEAWGAVFDSHSTQDAAITVSVRDHGTLAAEGSATSDATGGFLTGSTWVKGNSSGDVTAGLAPPQVASNYLFPSRYRRRFSFRIPSAFGNPFNAHDDDWGLYLRSAVTSGNVVFSMSNYPVPIGGFDLDNSPVTMGGQDSDPRIAYDQTGAHRLIAVFTRTISGTPQVMQTVSTDEGATWGSPVLLIASAKHPTIAVGHDGTIIVAAYTGPNGGPGTISATVQAIGDAAASSVSIFKDSAGTNLAVNDDTFGISQGKDGAHRWILAVVISGDSGISEWYSTDWDGKTWTRVT